mmetsp:Transcript_15271/g.32743  ORF Transcript_15271/g.32743 Transcript_15271/m.32743 type:complete len:109 (+) Transcript_15271:3992-4318(+)
MPCKTSQKSDCALGHCSNNIASCPSPDQQQLTCLTPTTGGSSYSSITYLFTSSNNIHPLTSNNLLASHQRQVGHHTPPSLTCSPAPTTTYLLHTNDRCIVTNSKSLVM